MKTNVYIIKLTSRFNHRKTAYLQSMRTRRLTKTRYATAAMTFKTEVDAQQFIDQHQAFFGYDMKPVLRDSVTVAVVQ